MAYTRTMFSHSGSVMRDSLEESAFIALSISITTSLRECQLGYHILNILLGTYIESDMVEADFDMLSENIWHPISGNCEEHR